jgi:hypothetical protein
MTYIYLTNEYIKNVTAEEYDAIDDVDSEYHIDEPIVLDDDFVEDVLDEEDGDLYDELAEEFSHMDQDEFESMLADIEEEELGEYNDTVDVYIVTVQKV